MNGYHPTQEREEMLVPLRQMMREMEYMGNALTEVARLIAFDEYKGNVYDTRQKKIDATREDIAQIHSYFNKAYADLMMVFDGGGTK